MISLKNITKLQTISLQKSWFTLELESYSWTEIPSKKAGSSYIVHHWPSLFCRSNFEYLLIRFCSFCLIIWWFDIILFLWFYFYAFPLLSQKGRALFGLIRFWDKASFHFTCGQMPVDWAEPERLSCSAHSTQISISQVLNLSLSR